MSTSEGFVSKIKNAFGGEKDSESSPHSTSSTSKEQVLNEAHREGEKHGASSTAAGTGATTGSAVGTGAATNPTSSTGTHSYSRANTGNKEHDNILKEAWEEGHKLFHHHAKTGNTGVYAGGTAAAGAAAGGVGGYAASNQHHKPTSDADYTTRDLDVVTSSSKGRVVTSPPHVSREPLAHQTPGDYTNSKRPTDSTVLAGRENDKEYEGIVGSHQSGTRPDDTLSSSNKTTGVVDNTHPSYSDDSRPAQGHGKFFDPKDTQGGVLGAATASTGATEAYNKDQFRSNHQEATKAEYVDPDSLKTKPTAYEQRDRENAQAEKIKDQAYEVGNRQGKKDIDHDPSLLGSKQVGGKGTTTLKNSEDADAIHSENKSAYNKDGVSGVLEKEQGYSGNSNKHHTDKQHPLTIKKGE
ncbi:hypothetical protein LELG_00793 [Lodderomyces elongisporus NRRL YB-4239]|uniref:Uncharacterized protein n=1 Tax=Lodderomyces elongisporus (strain ATCC 11503 / CBS 2605 / JCM 1781 / NBRC 1676 / NRRL YB-4239) TaxID=379508 RepID=A5DTV7_LODEL|nr:hypothetical protein LELG_00793 [Lodderomyces elongisporus NRRL YB-4239]